MKFGGTSLGDAGRVVSAGEIVKARLASRPVVVVSAFAGVTDLLDRAVARARAADREGLDPVLSDVARRHRWMISGAIADPARRHDLTLELDAALEELRQLLRAVRVLGEGTPRAADTLLAFGEILSSKIVVAAFEQQGLEARWIDPREVIVTDDRHGRATPDLEAIVARAERVIVPAVRSGAVPVMGGFVGATADRRTTTLGRGGSDTTAAVLGAALGAREIQIWTDVDGILSADPRLVPGAVLRECVSFAEAAELAYYGAKVLHPASIAPAVQRGIPVRVLNTLRPDAGGTVVVEAPPEPTDGLVSVASRSGCRAVRVQSRRMRSDPEFLPKVLRTLDEEGIVPDLVVSSEVNVTVAIASETLASDFTAKFGDDVTVDVCEGLGIVCVIGRGLGRDGPTRARVLAALADHDPVTVALGASTASAAALVPDERLAAAVRDLHRRFFETVPA